MSKHRSPNYPAIGLRDAVEAVRAIYDKEKKTSVSGDVIAGNLGYSSLSGNARTRRNRQGEIAFFILHQLRVVWLTKFAECGTPGRSALCPMSHRQQRMIGCHRHGRAPSHLSCPARPAQLLDLCFR